MAHESVAQDSKRKHISDGRTEPNLDDVALAFKDMNVNIADLEEYVNNVDPVPCAVDVPKYPAQKENHLNFLKPGSKEVVTRPVHIHEYLPPMYAEREGLLYISGVPCLNCKLIVQRLFLVCFKLR